MIAETNQPYPNRIQLVLAPYVGPLVQDGPLGAFDPRHDLEVYVDGVLQTVQTFSFDQANNRYLLFLATAFNLQGVIQIVYHVPSPSFEATNSVSDEPHTIPSPPAFITVTHAAEFVLDSGVTITAGGGFAVDQSTSATGSSTA